MVKYVEMDRVLAYYAFSNVSIPAVNLQSSVGTLHPLHNTNMLIVVDLVIRLLSTRLW